MISRQKGEQLACGPRIPLLAERKRIGRCLKPELASLRWCFVASWGFC
jgi:hypothetical protein